MVRPALDAGPAARNNNELNSGQILEAAVAWDFSTEPEFEEHLDWMRAFVREEIWPIETIDAEIGQAELDRIYAPLQAQVRERGLWAAHLPPELGGQGFGQVKLGLINEILGTSIYAPNAFGCQAPDSGNSEILALAGTPEQKERWLKPLLAGELKSAFAMTEPETPGSDPTQLRTRPVRGGLLRDKQTVQNWIADSAAQMQAARLMTLHAAWKIDTYGSSAARTDVSLIKVFGAQVLHDVIDRALQAHGGLGFSADMPL